MFGLQSFVIYLTVILNTVFLYGMSLRWHVPTLTSVTNVINTLDELHIEIQLFFIPNLSCFVVTNRETRAFVRTHVRTHSEDQIERDLMLRMWFQVYACVQTCMFDIKNSSHDCE